MIMLTQERLKELLNYDPETGVFIWASKRSKHADVGELAGGPRLEGYHKVMIDNKHYGSHRLAWLYMTGSWPKDQIDHLDHNGLNNKWENLREATNTENSKNKKLYKVNKSGHAGVLWHKKDKRWQASIRVNSKLKHLGNFKDKDEAIRVRLAAQKKYGFHINHGVAA